MFCIYLYNFGCLCSFWAGLCLAVVQGNAESLYAKNNLLDYECERISKYFQVLNEKACIEEVADFILSVKDRLLSMGYEVPKWTFLINNACNYFRSQMIEIEEKVIEELYALFVYKDFSIAKSSFQFINDAGHNFTDGKVVIGLCKILVGGLLVLIPTTPTKAVGAGLITAGIKDISEEMVEKDKENLERQEKEGTPPTPKHFPKDFYKTDKQIMFIEKGLKTAEGSREELLAYHPPFRALWEASTLTEVSSLNGLQSRNPAPLGAG